jgi:hypothetical protein
VVFGFAVVRHCSFPHAFQGLRNGASWRTRSSRPWIHRSTSRCFAPDLSGNASTTTIDAISMRACPAFVRGQFGGAMHLLTVNHRRRQLRTSRGPAARTAAPKAAATCIPATTALGGLLGDFIQSRRDSFDDRPVGPADVRA